jgi:hypothetical protein
MRLAIFLHTGNGQPPPEYVRYRMRMLYKCTPSELDEQKGTHLFEVLQDLKCLQYEIKKGINSSG